MNTRRRHDMPGHATTRCIDGNGIGRRKSAWTLAMLLLAGALPPCLPHAMADPPPRTATTNFKPAVHGFHFDNTFRNDLLLKKPFGHTGLDIHTSGLCGGMVYAALDYYYAHKPIPQVIYRPATGTTLAHYFYRREGRSIWSNITEWANMEVKPGGSRLHLYRRGLDGRPGHPLARVMQSIAHGRPVVLGLKGVGSLGHQVLAIGYDLGRYRGDLGVHQGDLKIRIYNPNDHDKVDYLVPDPVHHVWHACLDCSAGQETFRGFFVDTKYRPRKPPHTTYRLYRNDGKIHELILAFFPGNKMLYGGHANLDLELDPVHGHPQHYRNINKGARWLSNSKHAPNNDTHKQFARVQLHAAMHKSDIRRLVLTDTFHSGINHDKWEMRHLKVYGLKNNKLDQIGSAGSKFFTIKDRRLEVPITMATASGGQIDRLRFVFHSGHDPLRGNHSNLDITIRYADGKVQYEPNVNHGRHWRKDANQVVTIHLDRAVRPRQIRSIELAITARPGFHSDKWNMASVRVTGQGRSAPVRIAEHGYKRFTPRKNHLIVAPDMLRR